MSTPQRPDDAPGTHPPAAADAEHSDSAAQPHVATQFGYDSDPAPQPYVHAPSAPDQGWTPVTPNPYIPPVPNAQPDPYVQPGPYAPAPYAAQSTPPYAGQQPNPYAAQTLQQPPPYVGAPASGYGMPPRGPRPSGRAIASLICGCAAVLLALIPIINIFSAAAGVAGVVLGILALRKRDAGRGLAIGGLIVSGVGTFLSTIFAILLSLLLFGGVSSADGGYTDPFSDTDDDEIVNPQIVTASDPGSSLGTADSPAPVDTKVQLLSDGQAVWELTIGASTLKADDLVAAADPTNHPPAPGNQYAMLPITITNVGNVAADPYWDLYVDFVGSDGITYYEFNDRAPDGLVELDELQPGESGSGNVVVEVPSAAVAGGMWAISYDFSDDYHFVAE